MWGSVFSPPKQEGAITEAECLENNNTTTMSGEKELEDETNASLPPQIQEEPALAPKEIIPEAPPFAVRQDNPNHIVMLQAQIQTLHRQMEERMVANAPATGIQRLQETFEARMKAHMEESNRCLSTDIDSELSIVKTELQNMQIQIDQEMDEVRQFVSNEFDAMEQKIQQSIAESTEEYTRRYGAEDRALKQINNDESEKYAQLESKLADLEGVVDHVDDLRRQVSSQQNLLQSCQRRLREMQRDRDVYKEKLTASNTRSTRAAYTLATTEPQQDPPSSITAKAKLRLSEKRQQSLKFHETLNHLKFMTEGSGADANNKQQEKKRELPSRGGKLRESHKFEKRNPSH